MAGAIISSMASVAMAQPTSPARWQHESVRQSPALYHEACDVMGVRGLLMVLADVGLDLGTAGQSGCVAGIQRRHRRVAAEPPQVHVGQGSSHDFAQYFPSLCRLDAAGGAMQVIDDAVFYVGLSDCAAG